MFYCEIAPELLSAGIGSVIASVLNGNRLGLRYVCESEISDGFRVFLLRAEEGRDVAMLKDSCNKTWFNKV